MASFRAVYDAARAASPAASARAAIDAYFVAQADNPADLQAAAAGSLTREFLWLTRNT